MRDVMGRIEMHPNLVKFVDEFLLQLMRGFFAPFCAIVYAKLANVIILLLASPSNT